MLRHLQVRGPLLLADCLRAACELARARRQFHRLSARELVTIVPTESREDTNRALGQREQRLVERIAFTVPRVAQRVPWRADCMIQAMAAQSWLKRAGIGSTMCIGVKSDASEGFAAHAWLTVRESVVTGGDVSPYTPLEL